MPRNHLDAAENIHPPSHDHGHDHGPRTSFRDEMATATPALGDQRWGTISDSYGKSVRMSYADIVDGDKFTLMRGAHAHLRIGQLRQPSQRLHRHRVLILLLKEQQLAQPGQQAPCSCE